MDKSGQPPPGAPLYPKQPPRFFFVAQITLNISTKRTPRGSCSLLSWCLMQRLLQTICCASQIVFTFFLLYFVRFENTHTLSILIETITNRIGGLFSLNLVAKTKGKHTHNFAYKAEIEAGTGYFCCLSCCFLASWESKGPTLPMSAPPNNMAS